MCVATIVTAYAFCFYAYSVVMCGSLTGIYNFYVFTITGGTGSNLFALYSDLMGTFIEHL